MRRREPASSRSALLHAVVGHLISDRYRRRLDPVGYASDGHISLRAALAEAVTPDELALCRGVAAGDEFHDVLGPRPSDDAVRAASVRLVKAAGVRWRGGRWAVVS